MSVLQTSLTAIEKTPFLAFGLLLLVAFLGNFVVKRLLVRMCQRMIGFLSRDWGTISTESKSIRRLANVVPALILMHGIEFIPNLPKQLPIITKNVCSAWILLTVALALGAAIDTLNVLYSRKPEAKTKPIKGYLQVTKIILFVITAVLMVSALVDRSPVILLSGLGAMAAVLMLIFQDTILSLVASVQLSSGDMVRVGDWIEMPNLNADGDVIDIALHTVKVQNWDKTITTLPTRRLITDPFKNWRGMHESGGRRIKRSIFIDQNSIGFLSPEAIERLRRFHLLEEYLCTKQEEIAQWNEQRSLKAADQVNFRRITNLGTFRAYVLHYLKTHPGINLKMTLMVRQLNPTPEGLPLEIYCFTNNTVWAVYEGIQSDIFDHLLSILPEFGLRVFQSPSGVDFKRPRSGGS